MYNTFGVRVLVIEFPKPNWPLFDSPRTNNRLYSFKINVTTPEPFMSLILKERN